MPLRVGLTGGLASGKSVVGRELQRLGCHLIEADQLGHQTLLPGGEAYRPVLDLFGPEILDAQQPDHIDRKKLGAIVFPDREKLAALNAIVHPAVKRLTDRLIAALPGNAILIYEAAILVETGGYRNFDKLIVAACPEEMQISRAMARDGLSREAIAVRLKQQLPLSEKVRHADYVIDTSGTLEQTLEQTAKIYQQLRQQEPQQAS
jgi:dephospho-CoA kinase